MYKRATIVVVSFVLALTSVPAFAEDSSLPVLSDAQISTIRKNCVSVQATLTRIHTNDALNRVHLGQEYETISSKFMAPMNSRVALAKLDGIALAKTTVDFNSKLGEFRNAYQQYEQTLLKAMQIKCTDQPVAFFDTVVLAQQYRGQVRTSVEGLASLVAQYQAQVTQLRSQISGNNQQADSE